MQEKTVLYFTATGIPTEAEYLEIALLQNDWRNVLVRRSDPPAGLSEGSLEPADALAGTIPTEYDDAILDYADGDVSPGIEAKPEAILILPVAATSIAAAAGTIQLRLAKAERDPETGLVTLTDITAHADTTWTSGTEAKGTVGASTGLVTGAGGGAGTSVITATVEYAEGLTTTKTKTITFT